VPCAMTSYAESFRHNLHLLDGVEAFFPSPNPTLQNPAFADASYRLLIVRLSPSHDVDRSVPHLFLFQEARRALPNAYIDMAFLPGSHDRAAFDRLDIPLLVGTQSLRPLQDFDLVLVSNAYTLELINLPFLLLRSGVPLFASERASSWPPILLGGSNAMASQAIIRPNGDSLADGIFFGEGEGRVGDLVSCLRDHATEGKAAALKTARDTVPGLWVAGSLETTVKSIVCKPNHQQLLTEYPILNTPAAGTADLQITYGCPAFCSFCFEGYDRKPYREVPWPQLISAAEKIKREQGNEAINLYGFNFNSHERILDIILALNRRFQRVSYRSQRLDILNRTSHLLEAEVAAGKDEFTFGIEGISERQRGFLHKSLSQDEIRDLLHRLLRQRIRRLKLFYILTGHESEEDVREFREFVKWVKQVNRSRRRPVRVIFSFGLLIRMPFTPLRYAALSMDESTWRPRIGKAKSACETNGFEFRLAYDWETYCTTQVLAIGGYWLADQIAELARREHCFDGALPPSYWEELQCALIQSGQWNGYLLGEKPPDYEFALGFVDAGMRPGFLYSQYEEAKRSLSSLALAASETGVDSGYCLGDTSHEGTCLGCGACTTPDQRLSLTHHTTHYPQLGQEYLGTLERLMADKRRLAPGFFRILVDATLAGADAPFVNAFVFRELVRLCPDQAANLLEVRESLLSTPQNSGRFPGATGETVFSLKAWDIDQLAGRLEGARAGSSLIGVLGPAQGFQPGVFKSIQVDIVLPEHLFYDPRSRLEAYLRTSFIRFSVRRDGTCYTFDLPGRALKKKVLFGGSFESERGFFRARLVVGPKFDGTAFLDSFGTPRLSRHAQLRVSRITW
jgi:hypothetical protein